VTSPVERITVVCPACAARYGDWTRGSVDLDLEGGDPADLEVAAYVRECETAGMSPEQRSSGVLSKPNFELQDCQTVDQRRKSDEDDPSRLRYQGRT
jgi:hypothetical protein